ncbi:hypothetical protein MNBD_GAMMA18-1979 [hydrothermal vent metagenome]|uniref:Hemerythrin-like domain-containing protein n=1 Tax=hydrothermal vent metagenome TaxID=652676 RepID=A0A3B0Z9H5_9ZZZZ
MKRASQLRQLSVDHHQCLVLARRAKRLPTDSTLSQRVALWEQVKKTCQTELEPHFQIEETHIAAPLKKSGENTVAEQLYSEHQQLRELVTDSPNDPADHLVRFGELLESHIRFEERTLFVMAQDLLGEAALDEIEKACASTLKGKTGCALFHN